MTLDLTGANTLLVTPFRADGTLDDRSLERLINHVIDGGARGIILLGSTGEFFGLTHEERLRVIRSGVAYVDQRVPVTVGVGSDGAAESIELSAAAESAGADCIMVIPPIYFDTSAAAQLAHYTAVAASTELDVMLYDGSNGIRLDPEVLRRAHDTAPNIRYAKIATADPALFEAYRDAAPAVTTIVGEDMMLFQGLRAGGRGSATAIGNILPREIAALHDAFENGHVDAAYEIATRLSPVTMYLSIPKGGFIAKFKQILALQGVIESDHVRAPLRALTDEQKSELTHDVLPLLAR
ncbi:dihydrodipicolinate synthase family protein [Microbacterium sp. UBA3486]|uniref:dihydrodipicolinate synthase family protein n=1 Tax=Microbacterium TaxID=33882 RepID=UPI0025FC14E9|nr:MULTISPECIES: dihydrodipicolinate synthase family protein [Microbacterium]